MELSSTHLAFTVGVVAFKKYPAILAISMSLLDRLHHDKYLHFRVIGAFLVPEQLTTFLFILS